MKTLKTKVFHLNAMGWYGIAENQKLICDDMRFIARTEWKSHEDLLDEKSLLLALPELKATIPDPKNEFRRIAYRPCAVTYDRRQLSYFLQFNDRGEPLRPPRLLSRVRDWHLYVLTKKEITHYW
jgi:hypothetical protein